MFRQGWVKVLPIHPQGAIQNDLWRHVRLMHGQCHAEKGGIPLADGKPAVGAGWRGFALTGATMREVKPPGFNARVKRAIY